MPKDDPETAALKTELTDIINKIKAEQEKVADAKLGEKCGDMGDIPKIRFVQKKTLKGHINKVNSVHYSGDSRSQHSSPVDAETLHPHHDA